MKVLILILSSSLLFLGCGSRQSPNGFDEAKTREVVAHHWHTFQDNDLDGVMADYTEDSVLITPHKIFKGMKEIRDNFVDAYVAYPKSATVMKLNKTVINRDVGYILWEAAGPKVKLAFGTDTFVIKDGKIITQTYGGVDAPAQQAVSPAATAPASDPFASAEPRIYITSAEIIGRIKDAETAVKQGVEAPANVLLKSGSTTAVMSYRYKPAESAEVHETEDELFVVLEGGGAFTMGGKLVDPTRHGSTLSSRNTEGGEIYKLAKGNMILVPENTPHRVTQVDGPRLVLLSVHILRPPM